MAKARQDGINAKIWRQKKKEEAVEAAKLAAGPKGTQTEPVIDMIAVSEGGGMGRAEATRSAGGEGKDEGEGAGHVPEESEAVEVNDAVETLEPGTAVELGTAVEPENVVELETAAELEAGDPEAGTRTGAARRRGNAKYHSGSRFGQRKEDYESE